jgi:hypothetical protein
MLHVLQGQTRGEAISANATSGPLAKLMVLWLPQVMYNAGSSKRRAEDSTPHPEGECCAMHGRAWQVISADGCPPRRVVPPTCGYHQ